MFKCYVLFHSDQQQIVAIGNIDLLLACQLGCGEQ